MSTTQEFVMEWVKSLMARASAASLTVHAARKSNQGDGLQEQAHISTTKSGWMLNK